MDKAPDELLIAGRVYRWGEILLHADCGALGWNLLCIDPATGRPFPPARGVVCSYFLRRGFWYEAVYADAAGKRVVGDVVEIDLAQLQDIAYTGELPFVEGHVYSDGKDEFLATCNHLEQLFMFALWRVVIRHGHLVKPIIADSLVGYMLDTKGHWWQTRVGNATSARRMVTTLYSEFVQEVMPKLQHVRGSIQPVP